MALLYPDGHPRQQDEGMIDVVNSSRASGCAAAPRSLYAPSELTTVIVGDVDPAHAGDAVERVFGGWKEPAPPSLSVPPGRRRRERRRVVIPMMNKAQADIAYGFTITRTDPSYYALWLMTSFGRVRSAGGSATASATAGDGITCRALDANIAPGRWPFAPGSARRTWIARSRRSTRRSSGLRATG